jgi:TRAP-type mannitol/chloroaromatic compound transport system substrate-binding protein
MFVMDIFPDAGIFQQRSGGLTSLQQALWYLRGGGDELAAEMYESVLNVKWANFGPLSAPEVWMMSAVPVNTLADFRKLKIRSTGDCGEIFKRMGVGGVVFLATGEIYESVQRGVIDAFKCSSHYSHWAMSFQEVAHYAYEGANRGPTSMGGYWANRDAWNKLTPDLQGLIIDVQRSENLKEYAEKIYSEVECRQKFIDYGTVIQPISKEIDDEFMREAAKFYEEKAAKDPFFAKVLKSQRDWQELCNFVGIK